MRVFVAGGAGFIGSHAVGRLLADTAVEQVTVYDNFSSGKESHLPKRNDRLAVERGDISDMSRLTDAIEGHDVIFHFASNPDIARAAREPDIDFWQGTLLTQNVVEAARRCGVRELVYASGSGVYGDMGLTYAKEDHGPLVPISTYAASKLAGEALICAYCHMFGLQAWVFRFANVVGPRQTHGVIYDFLRKLKADHSKLQILGDGAQSKSYVHVSDILEGIWTAWRGSIEPYNCFNIATDDAVTVSEIAQLVARVAGLPRVRFEYTGSDRGWKGDVPIVRMDTSKLKALGWRARQSSLEALESSAQALLLEVCSGLCAAS